MPESLSCSVRIQVSYASRIEMRMQINTLCTSRLILRGQSTGTYRETDYSIHCVNFLLWHGSSSALIEPGSMIAHDRMFWFGLDSRRDWRPMAVNYTEIAITNNDDIF